MVQSEELVIYSSYQGFGWSQDILVIDLFYFEVFYCIKPILNLACFTLKVWILYKVDHKTKYLQHMFSV